MKQNYWDVTNEQVIEKTGKSLADWTTILDKFDAAGKKTSVVVAYLQEEHSVQRYWARTLVTNYLKAKNS